MPGLADSDPIRKLLIGTPIEWLCADVEPAPVTEAEAQYVRDRLKRLMKLQPFDK